MKKQAFISLKLIFSFICAINFTLSHSQPEISFEKNFGYENMDSSPTPYGLFEIGSNLMFIQCTYGVGGDNFIQNNLKIINKLDGEEIYTQNLSNGNPYNYYEEFYIKSVVSSAEAPGYFFTITKDSSYDELMERPTSLYNYETSNGLTLLNTYETSKTNKLIFNDGNLFLIDLTDLSISVISLIDYEITENISLVLDDTGFTSARVFELENNDFLLIGNINAGSNNNDIYLAKFDLTGEVYWQQTIGGNRNDSLGDAKAIDGDIYLCGRSFSYDGIFADQYGPGIEWGDEPYKTNWALKLDSAGNIIWNKLFEPNWSGYKRGGFGNIYHSDDFIILSGSTYNQYDYNPPFDTNYTQDVLAVKIDLDGNLIWSNAYGGFNDQGFVDVGLFNDQLMYVVNLSRYAFLGVSNGGSFFGSYGDVTAEQNGKFDNPLIHEPNGVNNQNDIWIFAIDFDGNIQWNQLYGGERSDYAYNTIYDGTSAYVLGQTRSTGYDVGDLIGNEDTWLFKLGGNSLSNNTLENDNFIIHPSPVKNTLTIDGLVVQDVVIYSVLGKVVLKMSNQNTIDVSSLSKGVYFIKVSDGINASTKKFIKD